MVRFCCPICKQNWKDGQESIQCGTCLNWVHHNNRRNCSGLTDSEFKFLSENDGHFWQCEKCFVKSSIYTLPFNHLDDENWLNVHNLKVKVNPLSEDVKFLSD